MPRLLSIFYKIVLMRRFILSAALLLLACPALLAQEQRPVTVNSDRSAKVSAQKGGACVPARADKHDAALNRLLFRDFKQAITKFPSGRDAYARLRKAGPRARALRFGIRRDPAGTLASYNDSENIIYFNSLPMFGFFGMKGAEEGALKELLYRDPKARAALVARADATFLHELVHALQYRLYPNYRRGVPEGVPLEFEYEAYMTDTMYTHEKMRQDPELLKAFFRGERNDVYTVTAMNAYLALSLDLAAYKERIREVYEDGLAMSLEKAERLQRALVARSKIFAYATGAVGEYADKQAALKEVQAEKDAYAIFFKDYYGKRWPSFSAEALLFIGSEALEAKLYPLALECLAVADVNAVKNGAPQRSLPLREKGALAVLEAAAYVKDQASVMGLEDLSRHLRALEKACANTGRAFPEALAAMRGETYPRAFKFYSKKAAAEKDPRASAFYAENADYFLRASAGPDGSP